MEKWTQDEAIAFESAREVITDLRAILTGQIHREAAKDHPDTEQIAQWQAERSRLFRERTALRVKDQENVTRVQIEYGARVRAWRTAHAAEHHAVPG